MIAFADKQAAKAAGWMALATLVMLVAGIVALATGIPLDVSGLFLITAAPCALVTVSLYRVAVHGRGGEATAPVPVDQADSAAEGSAAAEDAEDSATAEDPAAETEPTVEPEVEPDFAAEAEPEAGARLEAATADTAEG